MRRRLADGFLKPPTSLFARQKIPKNGPKSRIFPQSQKKRKKVKKVLTKELLFDFLGFESLQ